MLFGAFIGLILLTAIFSMVIWAPWIGEDLGRHKRLAQAVVFTAFNFAIFVYTLWERRRNPAFWPTIFGLFVLHVSGIFFYSTHVQPILVWQWPILGILEYYAAAFFLYWSTRRFSHDARQRRENIDRAI